VAESVETAPAEVTETTGVRLAKVAAAEVPVNRRRGGDMRVVLGPKTCGSTTGFMGSLTLAPGHYVSEHYHPYSEEFLYVVSGTVQARIDGEQFLDLGAGEGLMIPKNVRHRVTNPGTETAFVIFHLCPLAPKPELGHVDTEPQPRPADPQPDVGGAR
jgi:putative monooxygenase